MEYIYSALVLHAAGKTVNEDSIANCPEERRR